MLMAAFCVAEPAAATSMTLLPASTSIALGGTVQVGITANIDATEAIIGFGFDQLLSPSGILNFVGFTPGPLFADDPLNLAPFSDSDGIRGASNGDLLTGSAISGINVLLGTLAFQAIGIGTTTIGLGADDLNFFYTEGLIPENTSLTNFLPTVVGANVTVSDNQIPSPPVIALMAIGFVAMRITKKARQTD